jgi:hypothetical protein
VRRTVTLALLGLAFVSAPAFGTAGKAYVPTPLGGASSSLEYQPQWLVAAGDGTAILTHVQYQSYGGPRASARAILLVDDCRSSCASGTFHPVRARLLFAGVVRCRDKRVYSTVRILAPGAAHFGELTDRLVELTYLAALCEPGER